MPAVGCCHGPLTSASPLRERRHAEMGLTVPFFNAHAGHDSFTEAQAAELFGRCSELGRKLGARDFLLQNEPSCSAAESSGPGICWGQCSRNEPGQW